MLLASAVGLAGCTTTSQPNAVTPSPQASEPGADEAVGDVLRWGLGADPLTLDPASAAGTEARVVADALFDSLTRLDSDGRVLPAAARSWSVAPDGLEITFRLREDATFHDGQPVTASDVVRGWTRVLVGPQGAGPTPAATLLATVVGADSASPGVPPVGLSAPDAFTLVVRTASPTPDLPAAVAHPALAPVPPAADEEGFGTSPIGNGPFRLAEPWARNQFLRLVRHEEHPQPATLAGVDFRLFVDDVDGSRRYDELVAGRLDVGVVPAGRRAEARREFGVSDGSGAPGVHDGPTGLASVLLLDTTSPPLDDVRVRRAVSLLVDREALASISGDDLVPAVGLLPSSVPGALSIGCRFCRFDPEEASTILEPIEVELPPMVVVSSDDRVNETMARDLAARLRATGVPASVRLPSRPEFLAVVDEVASPAARVVWAPVAPDLASWTTRLFGAGAPGRALTRYAPSPLRELLATARGSSDPTTRRSADLAALRLLLDEAVVVPLVHYRDDLVTTRAIRGLVRGPLGDVDLTSIRVVPAP